MPPEDRPQPSEAEFDALTGWIQAELQKGQCGGPVDPGRVTIRRLNRAEYNNTIRDLLGIDFRPADDFPSDDVGYGFDNIGDVLSMPPLLLEKYMAAAEKIAAQAIVDRTRPGTATVQAWEAEDLGSDAGAVASRTSAGSWPARARSRPRPPCPTTATYILRVRAFGQQAGPEPARMAIRVDGKTIRDVDVPAVEGAPGTYEVRFEREGGPPATRRRVPQRLSTRPTPRPAKPGPEPRRRRDRGRKGRSSPTSGHLPESHRRIFFRRAHPGDGRDDVRPGDPRAVRQPCLPPPVDRRGGGPAGRVRRPGREERRHVRDGHPARGRRRSWSRRTSSSASSSTAADGAEGEPHPIGDYELATRLSYFLWSSMPDDELFALAGEGDAARARASSRPRSGGCSRTRRRSALVENFAGQWLQLRNLKTVSPDPKRFPQLRRAAAGGDARRRPSCSSRRSCEEDRSVLDFLDADYTFLNERLARHYGIDGRQGRRVPPGDARRTTGAAAC